MNILHRAAPALVAALLLPLLSGVKPGWTQDVSGGQAPAQRPVLYTTAQREGLVISGVYPDGRPLGILARGDLAGWSPLADGFAYLAAGRGAGPGRLLRRSLGGQSRTLFAPRKNEAVFLMGWQSIWSRDGRKLALLLGNLDSDDFSLIVVDAASATVASRRALPEAIYGGATMNWPPYALRWSPDGEKVLICWTRTVVVVVATGEIIEIARHATAAEWLPTSDGVYYFDGLYFFGRLASRDEDEGGGVGHAFGNLWLKKLDAESAVSVVDEGRFAALGVVPGRLLHGPILRLSPDGSRLALLAGSSSDSSRGSLHIFDVGGADPARLDGPVAVHTPEVLLAIEWSPDGGTLAVVGGGERHPTGWLRLRLLNLETRQWTTLTAIDWPASIPEVDALGMVNLLSWGP